MIHDESLVHDGASRRGPVPAASPLSGARSRSSTDPVSADQVLRAALRLMPLGLDRTGLLEAARSAVSELFECEVELAVQPATEAKSTDDSSRQDVSMLADDGSLSCRLPLTDATSHEPQVLRARFNMLGGIDGAARPLIELLCRLLAQALVNARIHGTLLDTAEKYRAIFDGSPEGIVLLDVKAPDGPWPIRECNSSFCHANGYSSPDELRGKDILIVSVGNALGNVTRAEYLERIRKEGVVRGRDMHRRSDGSEFPVDFSTRVFQLAGQECILGIDRDVSEEVRLRRVADDLRHDIGRTFHTLSGTLIQVESWLTPTIAALMPATSEKEVSPPIELIWPELLEHVARANGVIRRLVEDSHSSASGREALAEQDWSTIERCVSLLVEVGNSRMAREMLVPFIQASAREMSGAFGRLQAGYLSRSRVREALHLLERLDLYCCGIGLRFVRDRVMDTDFLLRDIRERVETGRISSDEPVKCSFWAMVNDAVGGLAQLATYRRLDLNVNHGQDAIVNVVRHDVVRCINNLLHNAIKYSWYRLPGRNPWIDVSLKVGGNYAELTIEDYGVPVHADELREERVFEFGYRGRLAGDRGRIGTGVGLFDSRDVARRFGGDVLLQSRPASKDALAGDMSGPHLKTAILRLPIAEPGVRE